MATWVIEEHPEFRRWQRISVVQFLCNRERGIRGSGRCFELLMMRNWYSLCDMLITYPYYNFPDLKIDWTDDSWIYDEYNDPWVLRKYQLIHHDILRIHVLRNIINYGTNRMNYRTLVRRSISRTNATQALVSHGYAHIADGRAARNRYKGPAACT
ncbi:hypothetical protein DMN91_006580 [Ooceraea biroi]|uniref:Uncharacterized protein n=1 Tax=Ooceraea biroi TaxID=2015173 RepID=A0A3L8DQP4_OOCBI|nr:hypothetical protein DMN91_006580 [Ooceraea biroi]